jgi:hypothetical protein
LSNHSHSSSIDLLNNSFIHQSIDIDPTCVARKHHTSRTSAHLGSDTQQNPVSQATLFRSTTSSVPRLRSPQQIKLSSVSTHDPATIQYRLLSLRKTTTEPCIAVQLHLYTDHSRVNRFRSPLPTAISKSSELPATTQTRSLSLRKITTEYCIATGSYITL